MNDLPSPANWDEQFTVVDLLTDLQHYCQKADVDFEWCLNSAIGHFAFENGETSDDN